MDRLLLKRVRKSVKDKRSQKMGIQTPECKIMGILTSEWQIKEISKNIHIMIIHHQGNLNENLKM
jgi:hypothetical protein